MVEKTILPFFLPIGINREKTTIATDTTLVFKTKDTLTVAINKTTDIITIVTHQTSNKTEITRTNNHVGIIATEQIASPEIVKPVLTAED